MAELLSISNIAWPPDSDDEAIALSCGLGFSGVELAPSKVLEAWGEWIRGQDNAYDSYSKKLKDRGLAIPALQAIFFGVAGCSLFASHEKRQAMRNHFVRIARLAGRLGSGACVFGAAATRDPGDLGQKEADRIALDFFAELAPIFHDEGCCLSLEANPSYYKCRYVTHTSQAIELVRAVDHPGFRVNIDTGTIIINDEPPTIIGEALPYAGHFHVSEKGLAPLGSSDSNHRLLGVQLRQANYHGWRSVEMRLTSEWQRNLKTAYDLMQDSYRSH